MMSGQPSPNECPVCERAFQFIEAGGPCAICQRCCDCCSCPTDDFQRMQDEVRVLYASDLVTLFADDPSLARPEHEENSVINTGLLDKNMVRIAIWPYTMEDDEIVFDPETGKLTEEAAQKVTHYLQLNSAMSPPDEDEEEESPPDLES